MNRGCLNHLAFAFLLLLVFGGSTYFWFAFFVRGKSIQTPDLIGRPISQARAMTSDLGVILVVDTSGRKDRHSDTVPPGAIVWQNRGAGSLIKRGTRIYVGESLGPLVLSVPDLSGQSARTAVLRFGQRNLAIGNLAYIESSTAGVVAEDPPRGTVVTGQTPVSLLIGSGTMPVRYVMPDLINRLIDEIRPSLEIKGFRVSNVKFEPYPGIRDGIIIRQYPLPGSSVATGDVITLVVSKQVEGGMSPMP